MDVGYLGPEGTFTEEATLLLANGENTVPYHNFYEALHAVDDGKINSAVVPVENVIEGIVNATVDELIFSVNLHINEMLILPINQNLIAKKGTKVEDIKEVISHPHAIPQCKNFLNEYLPNVPRTTASSTAEAIRMVSASDQCIAGIGNKRAAELYGLEVLKECIQDNKNNFTQFVRVSKTPNMDNKNAKVCTLTFSTPNKPGELFKVMEIFSVYNLNMSKISSRPMKERPLEYVFMVDVDIDNNLEDIENAIKLIKRKTSFYKNLGFYPVRDLRLQK